MTHDARSVANAMIQKGIDAGDPLTPLQVIKLTYLCQAWMLGMFGEPMFDQKVEAWQYGPVIADVYHGIKHNRGRPVRKPMRARPAVFDEFEQHIIDQVYGEYGKRDGIYLSQLTHMPGSPWYETKQENPLGINQEISEEKMKRYYAEKLEQSEERDSG
ncbi:MAG: DUF4065 domain-containing protein [Caldilineaceae bacterium]|nr:DUF4065 domain-containing protein [Caldilineaceae bacterium]